MDFERDAWRGWEKNRNKDNRIGNQVDSANYKLQNSIVQRRMRKDKENHIIDQWQRIEENSFSNSLKDFYKGVKSLTNKFEPTIDRVKSEDGKILSEVVK